MKTQKQFIIRFLKELSLYDKLKNDNDWFNSLNEILSNNTYKNEDIIWYIQNHLETMNLKPYDKRCLLIFYKFHGFFFKNILKMSEQEAFLYILKKANLTEWYYSNKKINTEPINDYNLFGYFIETTNPIDNKHHYIYDKFNNAFIDDVINGNANNK